MLSIYIMLQKRRKKKSNLNPVNNLWDELFHEGMDHKFHNNTDFEKNILHLHTFIHIHIQFVIIPFRHLQSHSLNRSYFKKIFSPPECTQISKFGPRVWTRIRKYVRL